MVQTNWSCVGTIATGNDGCVGVWDVLDHPGLTSDLITPLWVTNQRSTTKIGAGMFVQKNREYQPITLNVC